MSRTTGQSEPQSRLMSDIEDGSAGLAKLMICWYVSDLGRSGQSRCVNTTGDMLDERMSTVS